MAGHPGRKDATWYQRTREKHQRLSQQNITLDTEIASRDKARRKELAGPSGLTPRGSSQTLERSKVLVRGVGDEEDLAKQALALAKLSAQQSANDEFDAAVFAWLAMPAQMARVERFLANPASQASCELQLNFAKVRDVRSLRRVAAKLEYRTWWPGKRVVPADMKAQTPAEAAAEAAAAFEAAHAEPEAAAHPGDFCEVCRVIPAELKYQADVLKGFLCRHCYNHAPPKALAVGSPDEAVIKPLPAWVSAEEQARIDHQARMAWGRPKPEKSKGGGNVVFGVAQEPEPQTDASARPASAGPPRLEVVTSVNLSQNLLGPEVELPVVCRNT
jgi:hypothetical protein